MNPEVFTTAGVAKAMQLQAWCGWFDTVFDVTVDDPLEGFAATSEMWNLGRFGLNRVQAPRLRAVRSPHLIRRNPVDHWIITVGQERTLAEAGKQGSVDVPAGAPFVTSLGREIVSLRDKDCRLQLYLPRDNFAALATVLDHAEGRPVTGAMGRLLADFLALLERNAPDLSEADLAGLQAAVHGMVLACIAPAARQSALGTAAIAVTRRETVRRIVDANLRNTSLGIEFLCRAAGMSRSQLYRLLESEGGVAGFIQRRRLRQSFADLSGQMDSRSISEIASALCFQDASSFSRSFKKEFGHTPTDVVHAALSGIPVSIPHADRADAEGFTLRRLLDQMAHG